MKQRLRINDYLDAWGKCLKMLFQATPWIQWALEESLQGLGQRKAVVKIQLAHSQSQLWLTLSLCFLLHSTPFPSIKRASLLSPLFTCPAPDFTLPITLCHTPDNLISPPWAACVFFHKLPYISVLPGNLAWLSGSRWRSAILIIKYNLSLYCLRHNCKRQQPPNM